MEEDQMDTVQEDAHEEQVDSTDTESEDVSEEQEADTTEAEEEPKLYAGKFKTPEELERSYEEIQRFVGSRKDLEAKAAQYDQMVAKANAQAAARSQVPIPRLQDYVLQDGSIDVVRYDNHMAAWTSAQATQVDSIASKRSQETADIQWAYQNFPYMREDEKAAQMAIDRYRAGRASSIREAVLDVDEMLNHKKEETSKRAHAEVQHELSKKSRGNTERPNAKTVRETGEMTQEKFARMSMSDRQKFINEQFKKGLWNRDSI